MVKGRKLFIGLTLVAALGFSLISCEGVTGFFSSSWGEGLKRDPANLMGDVKPSNVKEMVSTFAGDSEASKALLKKIVDAAANATGQDKADLQSAGLTAAVNASGLGTTILSSAGAFLNDDDDDETQRDKLTDVLNDLPDVQDIAGDIGTLFQSRPMGDIYPNIDENAGNDLVMAAVICLLGDYQGQEGEGLEKYMDQFASKVQENTVDSFNPKQKTAYYLLKTAKNVKTGEVLGEVLNELNF
ncbi:MAG: hypothetical protein LBP76_13555 [Treponema sp.]|jgi:hypothetical protein|nr:hypothetical protein [Treponema sp.]